MFGSSTAFFHFCHVFLLKRFCCELYNKAELELPPRAPRQPVSLQAPGVSSPLRGPRSAPFPGRPPAGASPLSTCGASSCLSLTLPLCPSRPLPPRHEARGLPPGHHSSSPCCGPGAVSSCPLWPRCPVCPSYSGRGAAPGSQLHRQCSVTSAARVHMSPARSQGTAPGRGAARFGPCRPRTSAGQVGTRLTCSTAPGMADPLESATRWFVVSLAVAPAASHWWLAMPTIWALTTWEVPVRRPSSPSHAPEGGLLSLASVAGNSPVSAVVSPSVTSGWAEALECHVVQLTYLSFLLIVAVILCPI